MTLQLPEIKSRNMAMGTTYNLAAMVAGVGPAAWQLPACDRHLVTSHLQSPNAGALPREAPTAAGRWVRVLTPVATAAPVQVFRALLDGNVDGQQHLAAGLMPQARARPAARPQCPLAAQARPGLCAVAETALRDADAWRPLGSRCSTTTSRACLSPRPP